VNKRNPSTADLIAEARATVAHMKQVRAELRATLERARQIRDQAIRDREARERAFVKKYGRIA
jgi:hypothetical protein